MSLEFLNIHAPNHQVTRDLKALGAWFEVNTRFAFRSFNREPQACALALTPFQRPLDRKHTRMRTPAARG